MPAARRTSNADLLHCLLPQVSSTSDGHHCHGARPPAVAQNPKGTARVGGQGGSGSLLVPPPPATSLDSASDNPITSSSTSVLLASLQCHQVLPLYDMHPRQSTRNSCERSSSRRMAAACSAERCGTAVPLRVMPSCLITRRSLMHLAASKPHPQPIPPPPPPHTPTTPPPSPPWEKSPQFNWRWSCDGREAAKVIFFV